MSQHTPKTTVQCPVCDREDWDISPAIQARYDGCAGLNPAAYREVVEALKAVWQEGVTAGKLKEIVKQALQHIEEKE